MSSKVQKVYLGEFRFEAVRLSPQEVKDRIASSDFKDEIPLTKRSKGIVASRVIPFSGETNIIFVTNSPGKRRAGAEPRGKSPVERLLGGEATGAYFMMRRKNTSFSISLAIPGIDQISDEADVTNYLDYSKSKAVDGLRKGARFFLSLNDSIRSVSLGDINDDGRTDILVSLKSGGAYLFRQSPVLSSMLCTPDLCTVLQRRD